MTTLRAWALLGVVGATLFALPHATAKAGFGPWHFTVTATGQREFREVHAFPSHRACEDKREKIGRGIAQVLAERGGTIVGGIARRVRIGPCEAVLRRRVTPACRARHPETRCRDGQPSARSHFGIRG